MNQSESEDLAIDRLEVRVGRLLETGVLLSAACLAIGLVAWMVAGASKAANGLLTAGQIGRAHV